MQHLTRHNTVKCKEDVEICGGWGVGAENFYLYGSGEGLKNFSRVCVGGGGYGVPPPLPPPL